MPWITKEGRSVDEARDAAIAESGMLADELEIEVVNEGAKGLFGLGGEPAVVRVRPKGEGQDFRDAFRDDITPAGDENATPYTPAPRERREPREPRREAREPREPREEPLEEAIEDPEEKAAIAERQEAAANLGVEIVKGILERMDVEGEITTRVAGGTVYIEVSGEEMGILIGRNGATLEALQEIVRAGIQRRLKSRQAVVVDVESYWERRRKPEGRSEGRSRNNGGSRGGDGGGGRRRGGGRRGGSRGGRRRGGRGRAEGPAGDGDGNGNRRDDTQPPDIGGNR